MKSLGNRDKNKFTIQKPLTWYQLVKPPNSIQDFEYQSPNLHRLLQIPRDPQAHFWEAPKLLPFSEGKAEHQSSDAFSGSF